MNLKPATSGKMVNPGRVCDQNNATMKQPEVSAKADAPKGFRRLKWNELVRLGDFVVDEQGGFELWEGPGGFRADSFVKPIYRRHESRLLATKKLK